MNILDIKYYALLDAIAEQGSVKAAAASLSLTQPAISHRMREMERRLAVVLFERRGHQIQLAPAAHRLLTTAREVIPKLISAERDAVALAKSDVPSIKWGIDAHDTIKNVACHSVDIITNNIDIRRVTNGELTQSLLEGSIDFALLNDPPLQRGIVNSYLFKDVLVAVLPSSHALALSDYVTPREMALETYITYSSRRKAGFEFDLFFHPASESPHIIRTIESVDLILSMISGTQQGVTVLSSWEAATRVDDPNIAIRPLYQASIEIPWYVSYNEQVFNASQLTKIKDILKRLMTL